ncbi:MAG: sigma 54-interacting transcriptional regulator [Nitrospirae bacterium]|nr:sigma 54-interacting transcriptional regulator [Nitrospirota bacterium]
MEHLIKELMRYAKGLTALYVEDNSAIREEVYNILKKFFDLVETAADGKEGLQIYKGRRHDIVISDIKMPLMDGVQLSKDIRKIDKAQVIVIMSARDDSRSLLDLITIGVDKFIMKPLDNMKFLETLLSVCKTVTNEKDIQRYKTNAEAIFRSVSEAIITVDNETKIIEANDAARRFCGLGYSEIIGREFKSVFGLCSTRFNDTLAETLKKGIPVKINRAECSRRDTGVSIASITSYPLLDAGKKQYGAVMVIRDDTYSSTLENELNQRRQYDKLIGKSESMQKIYSLIGNLAETDAAVLITGESGTGKELAAEAIHFGGERAAKPLIKVNCSALPESLLESELFGHTKGAFTGAIADKEGRFQKANGGTIFLDEIGDISPSAQIRLLRVLQEYEFERVGSSTPVKVNVRVIAATNRNLMELVSSGKFREDLYYRLNVVRLHLPPLRERRDDIPLLVRHFIDKFNLRYKKDIEGISNDIMKMFMGHIWPGNVRELEHTMEHAYVVCSRPVITIHDLPEDFNRDTKQELPGGVQSEGDKILQALVQSQWRKNKAAALLGISRVTLYEKMKKFRIDI